MHVTVWYSIDLELLEVCTVIWLLYINNLTGLHNMDENQRSVSEGVRYPVNSIPHALFPSEEYIAKTSPVHIYPL